MAPRSASSAGSLLLPCNTRYLSKKLIAHFSTFPPGYHSRMRIPVLQGVIDRRLLVNYRVKPEAVAAILPPPFRPKLIRGWAIAGICLIRLRKLRPRMLPAFIGMSSENAAHRIAVEWDDAGGVREGVYIPRRDSNSRFNTMVGGRLFPGVHHHARFVTDESDDHIRIDMTSDDALARVTVCGRVRARSTIT